MINLLRFIFNNNFPQQMALIAESFTDFLRAESRYTSAILPPLVRSSLIVAVLTAIGCTLIMSVVIGVFLSAFFILPTYFPMITPLTILLLFMGCSFLLLILLGFGIASRIGIVKRIVNQYESHWSA